MFNFSKHLVTSHCLILGWKHISDCTRGKHLTVNQKDAQSTLPLSVTWGSTFVLTQGRSHFGGLLCHVVFTDLPGSNFLLPWYSTLEKKYLPIYQSIYLIYSAISLQFKVCLVFLSEKSLSYNYHFDGNDD